MNMLTTGGPEIQVEKFNKEQEPLSEADQVILVVGNTGVGKSTFIQTLTDQETGIGSSFSLYRYTVGGRRFVLVDTPGLDDGERSDAYVLAVLAGWLAASYSRGIRVGGVLYLHKINEPHMAGPAFRRLRIYQRLLGDETLDRTVLVTTQWPNPTDTYYHAAEQREGELQRDPRLLEPMIRRKAKFKRFLDSRESAFAILNEIPIVPAGVKPPLRIQKELIDQGLSLEKTQAGQLVAGSVPDMILFYETTLEHLGKQKDQGDLRMGAKEREAVDKEIQLYEDLLGRTRNGQGAIARFTWKKPAKKILKVFQIKVSTTD